RRKQRPPTPPWTVPVEPPRRRTSARRLDGQRGAVQHLDGAERIRVDAFEAGDVHAVFVRAHAALVMRVDAADAAKIVLRDPGVPLIERQLVATTRDPQR